MNKARAACIVWLLAALLVGCGEDPIVPPPPSEPTWNLLATGETFVDVWGCSPNAVFALGTNTLLFYNGSSWTVLPDPPARGMAIWGTSPENLFVIAMSVSPTRVRAYVHHYDGHGWNVVLDWPYPLFLLRDIWGSSDHDIFAAGDGGTILHYDGSTWSQMSSGTENDLRCLWGNSSTDVYAAGAEGAVLHYDGSTWTNLSTEPAWDLRGIWASSRSDIYCVGGDLNYGYGEGFILHYDGSSWRPEMSLDGMLWNVWGSSSTDIFAVGDYGKVLHYDGVTWTQMSVWGWSARARAIWASSGQDVFVVGGEESEHGDWEGSLLSHYDGTAWRPQATRMAYPSWTALTGVGGLSATDVYFIGEWGEDSDGSIRHFDGSSFGAQWGTVDEYQDVWAAAPDAVFAVSWRGRVDRYDAVLKKSGSWELDYELIGVWAMCRDDAFVTGYGGRISHYDGSTWSLMTTGTTSRLNDIWGSSGTDVFAVGEAGTVLHYDGSSWAPMQTGTNNDLWGVWGSSSTDVYAVGDAGTILHYDGVQWKAVPSMTQNRLTGVWGSSDRDVYVVGGTVLRYDEVGGGIVLHYNGKTWTTVNTIPGAHKVWGSGAGDVYVTERKRIFHYGIQ